MSHPVFTLYENHAYPAMSHPLSDPALSAVAASLGGLKTPHPARARILEIGCSTGHHLIPLALRWPESELVGMDLIPSSIQLATARAAAVGAANVHFEVADLKNYQPSGGKFDYIIAHGFFSWVPDEVKAALLEFCRENLTSAGIAMVSFNVEAGWATRFTVVQKVRILQELGGVDVITALEVLRGLTEEKSPEITIIDDMRAKGAVILAFDDFGPVNDAWSLDRFIQAATAAGLRWLGESDPAENLPSSLSAEVVEELMARNLTPLELQLAADAIANRTFRAGIMCCNDAPVEERIFLDRVLDFSLRAGNPPEGEKELTIWQAVQAHAPCTVTAARLDLPEISLRELAGTVYSGVFSGWLLARIEPVVFDFSVPEIPVLAPFRLYCARHRLPLVDVWHRPISFPDEQYLVLIKMDGIISREELALFSKVHCPDLAFDPWLRHLAERGIFS